MAPIRKMQFATCFKRIRVPSKDNPSILVDMWQPCSPGEKGAVEKTWNELDPKLIKEPDITISDLVSACANTRPSSNMEYIHKYKEWAVCSKFPPYELYFFTHFNLIQGSIWN